MLLNHFTKYQNEVSKTNVKETNILNETLNNQ